MNFFLGIFPDEETKKKITEISKEIKDIFEQYEISVRWSKPKNFHVTLEYIGTNIFFLKKFFLFKTLSKVNFRQFKITFKSVKLGISRRYKELIYLDLMYGGDEMRNMIFQIRGNKAYENTSSFVPHLTLGRVNKDLTEQEYLNLSKDLRKISSKLDIESITFFVKDFYFVKSNGDHYELIKRFDSKSL